MKEVTLPIKALSNTLLDHVTTSYEGITAPRNTTASRPVLEAKLASMAAAGKIRA